MTDQLAGIKHMSVFLVLLGMVVPEPRVSRVV